MQTIFLACLPITPPSSFNLFWWVFIFKSKPYALNGIINIHHSSITFIVFNFICSFFSSLTHFSLLFNQQQKLHFSLSKKKKSCNLCCIAALNFSFWKLWRRYAAGSGWKECNRDLVSIHHRQKSTFSSLFSLSFHLFLLSLSLFSLHKS